MSRSPRLKLASQAAHSRAVGVSGSCGCSAQIAPALNSRKTVRDRIVSSFVFFIEYTCEGDPLFGYSFQIEPHIGMVAWRFNSSAHYQLPIRSEAVYVRTAHAAFTIPLHLPLPPAPAPAPAPPPHPSTSTPLSPPPPPPL